ncbi:MAG: Fic family protein [Oscillospiraceae bacterium]|nr:Fic family protein [Oscillospiraceae bacterium]
MVNDIFEEYLREKEPHKKEKGYAWHTAIGLQAVDGLSTSEYLIETAKKNIEGDISFKEANDLIHNYYKENIVRMDTDRTEEADKVSVRIAQLLSEKSFVFSPAQYISIHSQLVKGIYKYAGKIRDYNITKNEWVLDGDTVMYGGALDLRATLDYDFSVEKEFSYKNLSMDEIIKHLAKFVSRLWQIHIFSEGNTRATAVFFIKYLRTLGFDVTNDIFAENAWYFRNALVRANYTNLKKGVHETTEYLELFLRNLLLGENNPLRNRDMHISGSLSSPKRQPQNENVTLDVTLDEMQVLNLLKKDGRLTQKKIAESIGKSDRTVKRITSSLEEKKYIERINGKRFGYWKVNID